MEKPFIVYWTDAGTEQEYIYADKVKAIKRMYRLSQRQKDGAPILAIRLEPF